MFVFLLLLFALCRQSGLVVVTQGTVVVLECQKKTQPTPQANLRA